jgi:hypothetical protein
MKLIIITYITMYIIIYLIMESIIDLNFSVNDVLEKFSEENLKVMRSEISRFRAYDLERLTTTEICICQNLSPYPCNKNAIYSNKKENGKLLCWYHALLVTKGTN